MGSQKLIMAFFLCLAPTFAHAFDIVSGKSDLDVFQDLKRSARSRYSAHLSPDVAEPEMGQTDQMLVLAGPEASQTKRSAPQKRQWNMYQKQVDDYLRQIHLLQNQVDRCYTRMRWSKPPPLYGTGYTGSSWSSGNTGGSWGWGLAFDDRRRKRHYYVQRGNYDRYRLWQTLITLKNRLRRCTLAEQVRPCTQPVSSRFLI